MKVSPIAVRTGKFAMYVLSWKNGALHGAIDTLGDRSPATRDSW